MEKGSHHIGRKKLERKGSIKILKLLNNMSNS